MARKRQTTTKYEIIQVAAEFFFEKGVSLTSPKMIADELDLSTGNITYYFPTKEQLLAVFTEMLCDFQWKMMEQEANEGLSSVMAICLELATMAAMCEENAVAKDFYLSTYSSDLCLEIIQRNDTERAMQVFQGYRPDWTQEQFAEAETIVSGIEHTTLRTSSFSPSLETRISGALETILATYGVQEETRRRKIAKVLSMDYRGISRRVLREFKAFVEKESEQAFEALFRRKKPI